MRSDGGLCSSGCFRSGRKAVAEGRLGGTHAAQLQTVVGAGVQIGLSWKDKDNQRLAVWKWDNGCLWSRAGFFRKIFEGHDQHWKEWNRISNMSVRASSSLWRSFTWIQKGKFPFGWGKKEVSGKKEVPLFLAAVGWLWDLVGRRARGRFSGTAYI